MHGYSNDTIRYVALVHAYTDVSTNFYAANQLEHARSLALISMRAYTC